MFVQGLGDTSSGVIPQIMVIYVPQKRLIQTATDTENNYLNDVGNGNSIPCDRIPG